MASLGYYSALLARYLPVRAEIGVVGDDPFACWNNLTIVLIVDHGNNHCTSYWNHSDDSVAPIAVVVVAAVAALDDVTC